MGSYPQTNQVLLNIPAVTEKGLTVISKHGLTKFIQSIVTEKHREDEEDAPFYVLDLGVVENLMENWSRTLPMVHPFYAVKCNPEPSFLAVMAALGSSFDCASRVEIESVLALGVSPNRIIYANPCKSESHIKYAASVGVNLTTFDSIDELEKIRRFHPNCNLLIRMKTPGESGARCQLGPKYGALPEEFEPLLRAAKEANLNVVGVSFHIGSGDANARAYAEAIAEAKSVFEIASRLGMPPMHILNIGGGFTAGEQFDEACSVVKSALAANFSNEPGLTFIAEPGRFFAESAFTLAAKIIGKRVRRDLREYWINDGIYGSMNSILYDHATVTCTPLACEGLQMYNSTLFGPTCDALDTVLTDHKLPEMKVNDWLVFPNMGAYTAAAGSNFNGFKISAIRTHLVYSNNP